MRSCRGKYSPTGFRGSCIDFNGHLFNISARRYKLLQVALEGPLSVFAVVPLDAHIWLSQTVLLPCHSTAAQSLHFQHEQPCCRQQSCQHTETWDQIHQIFTPEVFTVTVFVRSSSLERWWVLKHPCQLCGRRGHSIHTLSSASITSLWTEEEVCYV